MRVASVIWLRPEHEEAYQGLHRAVWPEAEGAALAGAVREAPRKRG